LTGGACAQIYSNDNYVTGDLDFVCDYLLIENEKIIDDVMTKLGFIKKGRMFFCDSIEYTVEFPPGPVGAGEEYITKFNILKLKTGNLALLSPTDSVKDRLVGYLYADDLSSLEQALLVCQMNDVDMDNIIKWSKSEGRPEKFKVFLNRYKKLKK
jgi:hypothetical protein